MSQSRRCWVVANLVGLGALGASSAANAQSRGFAINRYEPAERGGRWFVVDELDMRGSARPAVGATLDYAHKPLVVVDGAQNERFALVRHQAFIHAGAAVSLLDRWRLSLSMPFALFQDGEAATVGGERLAPADAPALGDPRLAGDVRLLGRTGDPFVMAAGLRIWLPIGLRTQFTGDGSLRLAPQLLASGEVGAFLWAARAAVVYRARDDAYAGVPLGSEVFAAVGAGARVGRFRVGPELFVATGLAGDGFLRASSSPAEVLLGAHYESPSGVRVSLGVGSGLTRGLGTPAARTLFGLEWVAPVAVPPPVVAAPSERVPNEDTDGDRIWDQDDACPGQAGVRAADPMINGCPPEAPRRLAVATTREILIAEQIQFSTDSAELIGESDAVLGAVKRILDETPAIRRVRVEGHTDDTGDPAHNDDLSRRRAEAVVRWLAAHGIDEARLVSAGFGSKHPLDSNDTETGRSRNRRVAFTILEHAARP